MSKEDALFIAGDFDQYEIPKGKRYLLNYFTTKIQRSFLKYVLMFGNYSNFVDHTGIYCQERYLKIMDKALRQIQDAHAKAKSEINIEDLAKIEDGKFSISSMPKV